MEISAESTLIRPGWGISGYDDLTRITGSQAGGEQEKSCDAYEVLEPGANLTENKRNTEDHIGGTAAISYRVYGGKDCQ